MLLYQDISKVIVNSAYEVHKFLGSGYLEKVLESKNLKCEQQVPLEVYYKDYMVGDYIADIIVEDKIILEIKAISGIEDKHFAQLLNYLKTTRKKLGFIINFGASKIQIKRIIN